MRVSFILLFIIHFLFLSAQMSQKEESDSSLFYIIKGGDFFVSGDYIRAESYFNKAFEIRQKLYSPDNILIAHTYNNLGVVAMKTWSYETALEKLNKAEIIYLKNPKALVDLGTVYENIGNLYSLKGDFLISEQYYQKALDLLMPIQEQEAFQRLAETYLRYGVLEYQKKNFFKSSEVLRFAIENYGSTIKHITLHNLYKNISNSYLSDNKLNEALYYYSKSLKLAENSNQLPPYYKASSYFGLAKFYIKTQNKSEAFKYLEKTKEIYNKIEIDSAFLFDLNLDYALYYETFNIYLMSCKYYQKALGFLTRQNLSNSFFTPRASHYIEKVKGISLLKSKSAMLVEWYKKTKKTDLLKYALESLTVATELIDNARNGYLTFESKLTIAESEASIYKLGIWCAHQLYQKTGDTKYLNNAFYFAEKNKSSILEATLQEEKAKSFAGIPDSLIAKEQKLKRNLTFYKDQIYEEQRSVKPDKAKLSIWNNYLFEFTREQEELKNFLEKNYADYFNLKYKSTTVKIESIQDIIDNNTTVIEYSVTDSILYIFEITKESAEMFSVAIDTNFFTDISDFLNKFRHFNFIAQGKTTFNEYINLTNSIYTVILAPTDQSGLKENIVIIPDDILSYLPFEAIVCPSEAKTIGSFRDMNYLVLNHTISYSYSSSLMVETHKQKKRKLFNRLVAFAPEYNHFSAAEIALNENRRHNYRNNLAPLPYALEEAQMVCTIARGKGYINRFATENSFVDVAARYDIIHLAMHTIIDDGNPQYSKLVFYSDSVNSDEGLLTTNEIFGLKLNAGLAVLSSCSSGEGEFKKGEGVLSLARGFFYAGCPSLVMTLWKVEDESGLTLMKFFYKYLRKGYSKPKALQKAKIEYLKTVPEEKQNPFYWSAYISIGNPSPLYYPRWTLYLITAGIIFLVYKCVRRIKKGKAKKLREPFA